MFVFLKVVFCLFSYVYVDSAPFLFGFFILPDKHNLVSRSEAAKLESEVSRENAAL